MLIISFYPSKTIRMRKTNDPLIKWFFSSFFAAMAAVAPGYDKT